MYELGPSTFHPTPLVIGPYLRSSPLVGMRRILRGGEGVQGGDKGPQELLAGSSPRQGTRIPDFKSCVDNAAHLPGAKKASVPLLALGLKILRIALNALGFGFLCLQATHFTVDIMIRQELKPGGSLDKFGRDVVSAGFETSLPSTSTGSFIGDLLQNILLKPILVILFSSVVFISGVTVIISTMFLPAFVISTAALSGAMLGGRLAGFARLVRFVLDVAGIAALFAVFMHRFESSLASEMSGLVPQLMCFAPFNSIFCQPQTRLHTAGATSSNRVETAQDSSPPESSLDASSASHSRDLT